MSKTKMPKDLESKCKIAIHTATTAAATAGALPIPIADTIPITAAQVTMIVALGKIFDMSISESAAKSIAAITLAQSTGRAAFSGILKAIPGAGCYRRNGRGSYCFCIDRDSWLESGK